MAKFENKLKIKLYLAYVKYYLHSSNSDEPAELNSDIATVNPCMLQDTEQNEDL